MNMDTEKEIKEAIQYYVHEYLRDKQVKASKEREVQILNSIYEDVHKSVELKLKEADNTSVYTVMASYVELIELYIK